jgi:hypothetical protein
MVTIIKNLALDDIATGTQTGQVGEPTVAMSGKRMFVTGNWFASRSQDSGTSWSLLSPFTEFPAGPGEFCCDQVVHYSKSARIWIWFLQYAEVAGSNFVRIAVSKTGAAGSWTFWDVKPTDINPAWTGLWFDYPDMAESTDHLYISSNVFDSSDTWQRAVVLRFPLADLVAGGALSRQSWTTTQVASPRFAIGSTDTMWFASHGSSSTDLTIFSWPDDSPSVSEWDVSIGAWNESGYSSKGPGNAEWLSRADGRITGAWRSNGVLGFCWTAGPRAGRPNPYIRCVRISEETMDVIDEPDLWSENGAWAYPATAPNRRGAVGMTAFFGGPTHPAHAVGSLDTTAGTWSMLIAATSTHGPPQGKWGDYLACRPHPSRPTSWVASGFVLNGGTDRRFVEPRVVIFRTS